MIKEIFFIIFSEYLNYYYHCPRTATVVFRSKEIPFSFHQLQNLYPNTDTRNYSTKSFQWHLSLSTKSSSSVTFPESEYNGVCNLSVEDISVMVYAIDNNCRLLTGDKTLKDKATLENIKVSGILFLTDMLTKESIVDGEEMITALERLLSSNNRLPKKLIKERIETLKRMTTL